MPPGAHRPAATMTRRVLLAAGICAVGLLPALRAQTDAPPLRVYPVQGAVSVIAGAGGNITVQNGKDGTLLVDTGVAASAARLAAEVRTRYKGPVLWIINTHLHADHVGGNDAFAQADAKKPLDFLGARLDGSQPIKIIAHSNVLARLASAAGAGGPRLSDVGLPRDEYATPFKDLRFNDEPVVLHHEPRAHTDGDTIVYFPRSDVISAGDIFTPGGYPFIDVANGGSITGEIDALNAVLDITVPSNVNEGGTMVIPGHGRLSDEQDVIEYRDMATIVRDRIKEYVKRGMTLDQVKAKKPTLDFDPRYGTDTGFWTTSMFVETIYKEMVALNPPAAAAPARGKTRTQNQKGSGE